LGTGDAGEDEEKYNDMIKLDLEQDRNGVKEKRR
jgi:hypothetical protein